MSETKMAYVAPTRDWKGFYACIAATKTALNGRCRNAAEDDGFCHQAGHVPGVAVAEPPKVVLINFTLNRKLYEEAKAAGILEVQRFRDDSQSSHWLESTLTARSFTGYRPFGDTGSNVFEQSRLRNVYVAHLTDQLCDVGMRESTHLEAHSDPTQGGRLVFSFRNEEVPVEQDERELSEAADEFIDEVLDRTWQKCDVWDNPPKSYGEFQGHRVQFQVLEMHFDGTATVVILKPRMDPATTVELPAEVIRTSRTYATSTVNLRNPMDAQSHDEVQLHWNNGYWDAI